MARVRDSADLSVIATPRGEAQRTVLVPAGASPRSRPPGAVALRDPAGRSLPLRVLGTRLHDQRPLLRLARGDSTLVEVPLVGVGGRLDGLELASLGLSGQGPTWYRDRSGLVVARHDYVPTPPSIRQALSFEWQLLTSLFEDEPPPLRVEIATPPENLEGLTRIEAAPWEITVVLTTLGLLMTGAGVAVLADTATRSESTLSTALGIGIGLSSIGFGVLGLGVGIASMFAGEDVQALDTGSLPLLRD